MEIPVAVVIGWILFLANIFVVFWRFWKKDVILNKLIGGVGLLNLLYGFSLLVWAETILKGSNSISAQANFDFLSFIGLCLFRLALISLLLVLVLTILRFINKSH